MWLLWLGCAAPLDTAVAKDSASDSASDSADSGDSATTPPDTGTPDTAQAWVELNHLEGGATGGVWTGGRLGTLFTELRTDRVACEVLGDWVDTGEPAPACPACDWAFTLTVETTTLDGHCAALELQGAREGRWDGFETSWAFGTDWYDEAYGITWDRVLLTWYNDRWFLWAYANGASDSFTGDAIAFTSETELDVYYRD